LGYVRPRRVEHVPERRQGFAPTQAHFRFEIGYQASFGPFTVVGPGDIVTQLQCDAVQVKTASVNVTFGAATITLAALGATLRGPYNSADGTFTASGTASLGGGQTGSLSISGKVNPDGTLAGTYQSLVAGSGEGCSAAFTAGGPPPSPGGATPTVVPGAPTSSESALNGTAPQNLTGVYTPQYPPAADATCPEVPPSTSTVGGTGGSGITVASQSTNAIDQLGGTVDSTGSFSVRGERQVGGGLGIQITGQFTTSGGITTIQDGHVTFNGPDGACTCDFTAARQS
jgi:hypothetical protein